MKADIPLEPPTQYLGAAITIRIDSPMGSRHPEWNFIYPLNYGFIPNVPAPDDEDLDAYLLGGFEPVKEFSGVCFAIIHLRALTEFQERNWLSEII